MEIKKYISSNIKHFSLGFVVLLFLFGNKCIAQPTVNNTKSYYISDGKMNIKLSKKLANTTIDSFIAQYGLEDLFLKLLIKDNIADSLIKKGWKIELNNADQCLVSKPLFAIEDIDNPFDITRLGENIFAPNEQTSIGNVIFGVNNFKTKSDFVTTDSTVSFFLSNHTNARDAKLAGSFTNWEAGALPMKKVQNGWLLSVKLEAGKHLYKFIVDGSWIMDENNKQKENDEKGNTNSVYFKTNTYFKLDGYNKAHTVVVSGSFNNWQKNALKLQKINNSWMLPMYLANGTYTYKFVVDGSWIADPANESVFPNEFKDVNSVKSIGTKHSFKLDGFAQAQTVFLVGSFNGWRDYEIALQKNATGWQTYYSLGNGNYEYKFLVDGKWFDANGRALNDNAEGSFLILNENYTFRLKDFKNAKQVLVAGDFNNWSEKGFAMKREGDEWVIKLHLSKGKHLYKFIVDGNWIIDPNNKLWEQNEHNTKNSILWVDSY